VSATYPESLFDAVAALRSGSISANELALQTLERARRAQQRTNCFLAIEAETLLRGAERADLVLADARRRGVMPVGALQGVPLAHKDMFGRGGGVVRYGSKVALDQAPRQIATATARLEQAGALAVGPLNMAEFALGATGHNAAYGDCRNAWNPEHISGGSSSGSGAAVACGAAFASLGSDTGGSVRIPASANGLVGLKPTYGLIPRTGSMKLAPSIDVIGPMARTTADLAEILQVVAGGDGIDANASLRPIPDYRSAIHQGVDKLRIGVPKNYFFDVATDEIREAMDRSLRALLAAGALQVDVTVPDVAEMSELSRAIVYSEATALHAPWLRSRGERYTPQVRVRASTGLAIPAAVYLEALQLRIPLLQRFVERVFSRCDVLLTPTLPIPVPRRDETDVGAGASLWQILSRLVHCTAPFNYLGLPAITVPAGLDARGLPMGTQYVARPYAESTLLRVAAVQQRAMPLPPLVV
jgi:aspartyl-tRNA(Asn)/glutamyl-tRNA(Gln) amidotransferase subunit A